MEAICSSEMSEQIFTTRCKNPKDDHHQLKNNNRFENQCKMNMSVITPIVHTFVNTAVMARGQ
jgi:hypothetical protein